MMCVGPGDRHGMAIPWALSWLRYHKALIAAAIALGGCTIFSSVGLMSTSGYLISQAALRPPILELMIAIVAVRFFGLSRAAVRYAERIVSHDLTFRLLLRFRCWIYSRLERLIPNQQIGLHSGDLLARLVSDVETTQNLYLRVASPLVVAGITTLISTVILGMMEPAAAVILLTGLSLHGLVLPLAVLYLGRKTAAQQISVRAGLQKHLVDSLAGIEELITLGIEPRRRQEYEGMVVDLSRWQRRQSIIAAFRDSLGSILVWATVVGIMGVIILKLRSGEFSGPLLAAAAFGILASFEAVQLLPSAFQYLEQAGEASRRIRDIVEREPAIQPARRQKRIPPVPSISFQNVSFSFPGGCRPALANLSLDLPFGSKTAIIGPSGAGKSTIVLLLCRFFDPQQGRILLGDHSLADYEIHDLRKQLAVVLQHPHLFNASIKENLLLARPGASDAELIAMLERMDLGAFIRTLPNGLDTMVGSEGLKLSGGESQRIAVAQALLKNAPILVLDEATTNLDIESERKILESVNELAVGHTLIVISHRPEALSGMDAVVDLRDGRLEPQIAQIR